MDERPVPAAAAAASPRRRPVLRVLLAVAVTTALAALIVWAVPFGEVLEALERFDPAWLPALLGSYALTFPCRAARFRALGVPLGRTDLTAVATIHQFMNRVLPVRAGELAFPVLVKRLCGTSLVEGVALIALGHLLDLALIAVAFLAGLLALPQTRAAVGPVGTTLVAAALPAMLAGYLLLPSLGSRLARTLAARWRARRPRWSAKLERAAETLAAVRAVSRRAFASAAVWTLMLWLTTFVSCWATMAAMRVPVEPAAVVVGSTAAILASVVPIGGIGSFGTLEGGWAAGFVLVGVAPADAVASALVLSGTTFAFTMVAAGVSWLRLRGASRR
ncbi:MAG: flippase-like domain-containing protein [Deltaproteobacteria bacterium]|nr:flippase-like domain-containing protein [Deltaproteobacteria bacterium]